MTSLERKEMRYKRRKAKRTHEIVNYDFVFSFAHLWNSYHKSCRNVSWKTSVKNYKVRAFSNVSHSYTTLHNGTFTPLENKKFTINERGKIRNVENINIYERVIEKCFCDYGLIPILTPHLIFDNGATLKEKGYWFTVDRIKRKFKYVKSKYPNSYVLTLDFHHYFENINHNILYKQVQPYLDEKSYRFYTKVINNMTGLNLGSQLSQISAIFYCNALDNIATKLCLFYSRYMDDTIYMFKSKDALKTSLNCIKSNISKLGLTINDKKTKIFKNNVSVLKKKFIYSNNKCIVSLPTAYDRYIKKKIKRVPNINDYKTLYRKLHLYQRLNKIFG